jgi:hypothetical protein
VRLRSGDDVSQNVRDAAELIRAARKAGRNSSQRQNTGLMARTAAPSWKNIENDDPLPQFCALAEELGIWLLVGSLAIKVSADKTADRSFLIGPSGRVGARDKITSSTWISFETYQIQHGQPGGEAVTVSLPWKGSGCRSAMICGFLSFTDPREERRRNPDRTVGFPETTGKALACCCGRGRSKMAASWWRLRGAGHQWP